MQITILDGHTLNPGDLSWDALKQFGNVTIYERTAPHELLKHAEGADVLLTNKCPVGGEAMEQLPQLKYIGVTATGYNIIDTQTAKSRGVVVTNVPGYSTASVAQLTFALLLELTHHVQRHSDTVMAGKWSASPDFSYWDYPLMELEGKTMGIIGFGTIGQKVADIAAAFGMRVIASSRTHTNQSHRVNFNWATVEELLQQADVVSIHCPLVPETQGLMNKRNLQRMKPSAFLLNTSRGPIVVDHDLAEALNNGIIAGAGLDVLSAEPPPADNPLFKANNCLITPHIAWASKEARTRLMEITVNNLAGWVNGKAQNVVDK
ncbi:D-2-hydroxyacid dehydrogenase [Mucilaginibacter hurinus]|uniref:D-2-hydroxyacid dehydrogenase n=1 Tax=Mucilaginibacter hurinus TaxID=2201324 RepID=A0A367GK58_9SPHI|nr:D-2-hydroxyacid dehydrogenase [Mucilaginibacter hurinus]RCH53864.1 D-2-hydroxyacid dehydrogenase [Mucilaginibacter hurinus]